MGRSQETANKKEREKQRARKQQEKRENAGEKAKQRKKGRSPNDMIAYLDENGNISSTPPIQEKRESIQPGRNSGQVFPNRKKDSRPQQGPALASYYNLVKGFSPIIDDESKQQVFVHNSQLSGTISENDRVQFEIENSIKGPSAVNLSKNIINTNLTQYKKPHP